MSTLQVGIAPYKQIKERTLAIARGERKPGRQEPKVWFTSAEGMARVFSAKNQELLEVIERTAPRSLTELAERTGRKKSNLSRSLKTMEQYGLVAVSHEGRAKVMTVRYDCVAVKMELGMPQARPSEYNLKIAVAGKRVHR